MATIETKLEVQGIPSTDQSSSVAAPASKKTNRGKSKNKSKKSKSASPSKSKSVGKKSAKTIDAIGSSGNNRHKSPRTNRAPIGFEGAVDTLSPVAMFNLSYIAHEPQGALVFRGYPWAGGPKKKSKSKKKK